MRLPDFVASKRFIIIASVGVVVVAIALYLLGAFNGLGALLASDRAAFDAFWATAGREESRNRIDDWRANDVGSGVSVGWLHFNQKHSIHLLMQEALEDSASEFETAFGAWSENFKSEDWVKTANLNASPVRGLLQNWLRSAQGERVQKTVARKYYFEPTKQMMQRVRPNADTLYLVVAAATRVWQAMPKVEMRVAGNATAQAFTDAYKAEYYGQEVWYRFGRQLANARSMLTSGTLEQP